MDKIKINSIIFTKRYGEVDRFPFGDLPDNLLPTDMVCFNMEDAYYSENNSYDAYAELIIYRERLETDNEFEARKRYVEEEMTFLKQRRHENYLKLKREFEREYNNGIFNKL